MKMSEVLCIDCINQTDRMLFFSVTKMAVGRFDHVALEVPKSIASCE